MSRLAAIAVCLLAGAAPLGCGSGGEGAAPAGLVPEDSAVYGTITLDPGGDQEEAIRAIAERFPRGDELDELVASGLAESFREEGLDYGEDVEPWLGDEAVGFVSEIRDLEGDEGDVDAAAVIATTDEDAARDALERIAERRDARERSYEGTDYFMPAEVAFGVVESHVVVGTQGGLRAAIDTAAGEESIEDSERVREALDRLPDDSLGRVYFDGRRLLGSLGPAGALLAPFVAIFDEPYVLGVTAEPDAVVVDATLPVELSAFAAPLSLGSGTEAVSELPADAWYAAGQPAVGETLQGLVGLFAAAAGGEEAIEAQVRAATGLDLSEDILGWMGDLGGFAAGTSLRELRAGLVIESKDPATSARALTALGRLARREADAGVAVGPLALRGGGTGFTIESPELPGPVHVVQRGDRVAAALGDAGAVALLEPAQTLADDGDFAAAAERLGEGYEASNWVEVAPILALAESEGADSDEGYAEAKPYLDAFARLIAGTRTEGDVVRSRVRVEFR